MSANPTITDQMADRFGTASAGHEYSSEAVAREAELIRRAEAVIPADFDGLVKYMGYGYPNRLRKIIGKCKSVRLVRERLVAAGISYRDDARFLAEAYTAEIHLWSNGNTPRDVIAHFTQQSVCIPFSGCWIWTGGLSRGYGNGYVPGRGHVLVHREAYEILVGPIPEGLHLDHLCRIPACWNPDHLEPVTSRENLLRGKTVTAFNAAKTHCPQGHGYIAENTRLRVGRSGIQRSCKVCDRERGKRASRARHRALREAAE